MLWLILCIMHTADTSVLGLFVSSWLNKTHILVWNETPHKMNWSSRVMIELIHISKLSGRTQAMTGAMEFFGEWTVTGSVDTSVTRPWCRPSLTRLIGWVPSGALYKQHLQLCPEMNDVTEGFSSVVECWRGTKDSAAGQWSEDSGLGHGHYSYICYWGIYKINSSTEDLVSSGYSQYQIITFSLGL